MGMPKDFVERIWKDKLGDLWPRLNELLDFFGPHGYQQIVNLLLLASSDPVRAIEMIESCRDLIVLKEEATGQPLPVKTIEVSKQRTTQLSELVRIGVGAD